MNVIREIERINAKELENGIYGGSGKGSWHEKYKNSAWVYVGGLPYELTEGDIICVMSQWGEIEDINLVREKGTNKSQGFAFVKYEDQRSTILAVDNFNGIQILQRMIRVDHVDQYKLPKEVREREEQLLDEDPEAKVSIGPGHAYKPEELLNEYSISSGVDHWQKKLPSAPMPHPPTPSQHNSYHMREERHKKKKRNEHKEHKEHKHKHKRDGRGHDEGSEEHKKKKKKHHRDHASSSENSVTGGQHGFSERAAPGDDPVARSGGEEQAARVPAPAPAPAPVSVVKSSMPASGDAFSWRGRRDPALRVAEEEAHRRQQQAEKRGPGGRREEFSGFGGMHRTR